MRQIVGMGRSRTVPKIETPPAADGGSALPCAPSALSQSTATEPEIIRWVARNIDNPKPSPGSCPDPFAWTLLRQCRDNPAFVPFFIEKLWAKLIPSRAQFDDQLDHGVIDGSPTLELIGRLREIKSRVEQMAACQVHGLEVAGSNPAPATIPDYFSKTTGDLQ